MKKIIFISPHFPDTYYRFVKAIKNRGFITLGIGDAPEYEISDELKECLDEYYVCPNMDDFENEKTAVKYFVDKYGPIDYLESNNEYWLRKDAILRELFDIKNGVRGKEIDFYTQKSKMKIDYKKAKIPVARFVMVEDYEQVLEFAEKVKFPIFIKPDIGVGAHGDFKIKNKTELKKFFREKDNSVSYIAEEFIDGDIVSFDGISNSKAQVIFMASNEFPPSIADVVKNEDDVFYYTVQHVDPCLELLGKRAIKAFNVQNRYFHLEFFRARKGKRGFYKRGDYIALETNMRPAGGYTPDLINFANSVDTYRIWADSIAYDKTNENMNYPKFFAGVASRRDNHEYVHSDEEVITSFPYNLCCYGRYPKIFSDAMGDRYFMAKFNSIQDMYNFRNFVEAKK